MLTLPRTLHYPAAYYDGYVCLYERTANWSPSYFGGPTDIHFTGKRHGPRSLHHVMTLGWDAIPGIQKKGYRELSLFYGMCYSGCTMMYEIVKTSPCRLLEFEPRKSSTDWPYSGYPDLLPYVPLRLARRVGCSPRTFGKLLIQEPEIRPEQVTVVVPPVFDLGVSLWGPSGDAEGVQIIFQCDLETSTVRAFNICS
jgi:hypothetical protein